MLLAFLVGLARQLDESQRVEGVVPARRLAERGGHRQQQPASPGFILLLPASEVNVMATHMEGI